MDDSGLAGQKYNFVCFRCGCIIRTGEKMVSLSVSVETPTEDGGLEGSEATAISSLCSGCAAVLLGQAITRDRRSTPSDGIYDLAIMQCRPSQIANPMCYDEVFSQHQATCLHLVAYMNIGLGDW